MTTVLKRLEYGVNRKRGQRLMQKMWLEAIYPRPNTSRRSPAHRNYPYRLRNLVFHSPNQVWRTDITYVPMSQGVMYLVAVMDWFSRYVSTWRLFNYGWRWTFG